MVFCGQCGYQLSPGERVCPRCGAATDANLVEQDPGTYNPTEISHAILERLPNSSPQNRSNQGLPEQAGPLILGPIGSNTPRADEATSMMSAQMYAAQPGYPGYPQQSGVVYPQQPGTGLYAYNAGGYQQYQIRQAAAMAQILEASRKGKVASLLLILFGLLLLVAAIIVFLLNQQGIILTP